MKTEEKALTQSTVAQMVMVRSYLKCGDALYTKGCLLSNLCKYAPCTVIALIVKLAIVTTFSLPRSKEKIAELSQ